MSINLLCNTTITVRIGCKGRHSVQSCVISACARRRRPRAGPAPRCSAPPALSQLPPPPRCSADRRWTAAGQGAGRTMGAGWTMGGSRIHREAGCRRRLLSTPCTTHPPLCGARCCRACTPGCGLQGGRRHKVGHCHRLACATLQHARRASTPHLDQTVCAWPPLPPCLPAPCPQQTG